MHREYIVIETLRHLELIPGITTSHKGIASETTLDSRGILHLPSFPKDFVIKFHSLETK